MRGTLVSGSEGFGGDADVTIHDHIPGTLSCMIDVLENLQSSSRLSRQNKKYSAQVYTSALKGRRAQKVAQGQQAVSYHQFFAERNKL
jgi:hypothetical protein